MKPGTAKIAQTIAPLDWYVVVFVSIGPEPRCHSQMFWTETEAREFCHSRNLKIV